MNGLTRSAVLLGRCFRDPAVARRAYETARQRVRSNDGAYGLKRDLDQPHTAPAAAIDIVVRPIRDEDIPQILGTSDQSLAPEEKWERLHRLSLLEAGFGTCYVAVTGEDVPCYTQWLFSHRDNPRIQRYFRRSFPLLDDDTALLEGAFTPSAFRGKRIMSAAMAHIAEEARSFGARYVITFVGADNTASLKGCDRAGFQIYTERSQRWRLLRSSVAFRVP